MKSYDGYFLLEYLIANSIRPQNIIYNGSKIMSMSVGSGLNIRVLDSLNFLPMKLAALPGSFGLTELKKGYFPHYFNTSENQNYIGPIPDTKYYGPAYMSRKDRKDFLEWHARHAANSYIFDFRKEMQGYCISDVTILREACLKFRKLLLDATMTGELDDNDMQQDMFDIQDDGELNEDAVQPEANRANGIDPFKCATIASMCMYIYKSKFLVEHHMVSVQHTTTGEQMEIKATLKDGKMEYLMGNVWCCKRDLQENHWEITSCKFVSSPIAQIPPQGYVSMDQHSKMSIQWLEWLKHTKRWDIRHALNGRGEYHVPGTKYKLYGYVEPLKICLEFQGCIFHGCRFCHPTKRESIKHPYTGQSMEELYVTTKKKEQKLRQMGYKYISIWECQFIKQLKENEGGVRDFVEQLDIPSRMEPRDSFFGGRTNASKLYHKVEEGETIGYADFTSLYPFVNKYSEYPVGHPDIITSDFKDIGEYFGIAKVKILPPRGLYHPVLPYRSVGKLKFPLCQKCADNESQTPCTCAANERVLYGTWCTPEIQKAVEKGYTIVKIYEVYHWDKTEKYDSESGNGGLFSEYINTFLKLKQEASGWPAWCVTENDRQSYIVKYRVLT